VLIKTARKDSGGPTAPVPGGARYAGLLCCGGVTTYRDFKVHRGKRPGYFHPGRGRGMGQLSTAKAAFKTHVGPPSMEVGQMFSKVVAGRKNIPVEAPGQNPPSGLALLSPWVAIDKGKSVGRLAAPLGTLGTTEIQKKRNFTERRPRIRQGADALEKRGGARERKRSLSRDHGTCWGKSRSQARKR